LGKIIALQTGRPGVGVKIGEGTGGEFPQCGWILAKNGDNSRSRAMAKLNRARLSVKTS
jgi:hypothetical protein